MFPHIDLIETGKNIKKLRKQKNLSKTELSKLMFVHRTSITNWESGRKCPGIDNLIGLATLFGVTIEELIAIKGR